VTHLSTMALSIGQEPRCRIRASVSRLTSSRTVPICALSSRARAGALLCGQFEGLAGPAVVM
jgi:hypothetical protein